MHLLYHAAAIVCTLIDHKLFFGRKSYCGQCALFVAGYVLAAVRTTSPPRSVISMGLSESAASCLEEGCSVDMVQDLLEELKGVGRTCLVLPRLLCFQNPSSFNQPAVCDLSIDDTFFAVAAESKELTKRQQALLILIGNLQVLQECSSVSAFAKAAALVLDFILYFFDSPL